jgi:hypothetical protein
LYPIPADQILSLTEIADHWARQIDPKRSRKDLIRFLERAWWLGEFSSENQISRLGILKALFSLKRDALPFWVEGEEEPKSVWDLPDGGAEVLLLSPIPVPSISSASWTDKACESAFASIAENWREDGLHIPAFDLVKPVVRSVCLSEASFTHWLVCSGYTRPSFWAVGKARTGQGKKQSKLPKKKTGPEPRLTDRVEREMRRDIRDGKVSLDDMINFKQIALADQYKVGRETAQKALGRIVSESVGDKNSG